MCSLQLDYGSIPQPPVSHPLLCNCAVHLHTPCLAYGYLIKPQSAQFVPYSVLPSVES